MMNYVIDMIAEMPEILVAVVALIVILVVALIAMGSKRRAERDDLGDQIANLRRELDSLDQEQRENKRKIEADEAAFAQAKEDFASQLQARDDESAAQLQAKAEEAAAQLQAKEEEAAAQLKGKEEEMKAREEEVAALIRTREEETAAQLKGKDAEVVAKLQAKEAETVSRIEAKDAELAAMQAKIDQWNADRDAIVSDARKQAEQIVTQAHDTADRILDEAAHRLAESEEEVRKNRLIAAGSLTDARKRISEMLLTAASELCKGIPANSPIGYAPVYSIDESENGAPSADEVFYEAEVRAEEIDEDVMDEEIEA